MQKTSAFYWLLKCFLQEYEDDIVLQILIIKADLKLEEDLTRMVDTTISTFGQIDILVSNDTLRTA